MSCCGENADSVVAGAILDAFIRGYTSKQWGVPPEKVPASVIARLKVRDSFSTDYFDDPHQGIPVDGYNAMFERMLDHPNITVECNREFTISNIRTILQVGGRLGGYRYLDMDQSVAAALHITA